MRTRDNEETRLISCDAIPRDRAADTGPLKDSEETAMTETHEHEAFRIGSVGSLSARRHLAETSTGK